MYIDNKVFIPGTGNVFTGAVGAKAPTYDQIKTWLSGDKTGLIGDSFTPVGHTSLESLPGLETETEGGESKGSWENPTLKTTPIKTTDTATITPIQWSETPLKFRFGKDTAYDEATRTYTIPDTYGASEVSLLIVIDAGGGDFMALYYPKASTAPEGGVEFSAEDFAGLPVKFTILKATGSPKMQIIDGIGEDTTAESESETE